MFFKVYTYVLHDILRLHKSSTLWPCSSTTPYPSASSYVMKTELGKAALYLYVLTWFECSSKIWLLFCWKCMKIALWFMDIFQTLTCSSMADSNLGFIASCCLLHDIILRRWTWPRLQSIIDLFGVKYLWTKKTEILDNFKNHQSRHHLWFYVWLSYWNTYGKPHVSPGLEIIMRT